MAYQALYRVFRSQRFSDLIGQTAITQTLKNAIATKKTSHAYLFTGPRGTGKTSAAKIFAKAINCPNSVDGEPCNVCPTCVAITEGRLNDVIEIDAASNNGVDEIRELRDKVKYAPTQAEFKVYIIDEVHMLSPGAFNALLKTLEEPPKSVIFILATTEPHKIPATIISRTQRFDFKKISTVDIVNHEKEILDQVKVPFEEEALYVVAKAADGGMRDALSILDQAISFGDGNVTTEAALTVTGSLSQEKLAEYLELVLAHNVEGSLEKLTDILQLGIEPKRFIENVMFYLRDLLMYQQAPQLLTAQKSQLEPSFIALAKEISADIVYDDLKILSATQQDLRFTNQGRIYLEVTTVKLATEKVAQKNVVGSSATQVAPASANPKSAEPTPTDENLEQQLHQLTQHVEQLEKKLNQVEHQDKKMVPARSTLKTRPNFKQEIPKKKVYAVLNAATREYIQMLRQNWDDVLQILTPMQKAKLQSGEVKAVSEHAFVFAFEYGIISQQVAGDADLLNAVAEASARIINLRLELVPIPEEAWPDLRKAFIDERNAAPSTNAAELENQQGAIVESQDEEKETEDKIETELVNHAKTLFGADSIEIKND